MKKSPTKLSLTKNTIRMLQDNELTAVNGGAPTQAATVCSGGPSRWCAGGGGGGGGGKGGGGDCGH